MILPIQIGISQGYYTYHCTLAKLTAICMYWRYESHVHGTDGLTSPLKDVSFLFFFFLVFQLPNSKSLTGGVEVRNLIHRSYQPTSDFFQFSEDYPVMLAPPGIKTGPLALKPRKQTTKLCAPLNYKIQIIMQPLPMPMHWKKVRGLGWCYTCPMLS